MTSVTLPRCSALVEDLNRSGCSGSQDFDSHMYLYCRCQINQLTNVTKNLSVTPWVPWQPSGERAGRPRVRFESLHLPTVPALNSTTLFNRQWLQGQSFLQKLSHS